MIRIDTLGSINHKTTYLYAHCRCGEYKRVDPNTVIERLGEGFLWANLRHVLRCKACGERPYVVQIVANAGGGM